MIIVKALDSIRYEISITGDIFSAVVVSVVFQSS
jgi:hypothetical protein